MLYGQEKLHNLSLEKIDCVCTSIANTDLDTWFMYDLHRQIKLQAMLAIGTRQLRHWSPEKVYERKRPWITREILDLKEDRRKMKGVD